MSQKRRKDPGCEVLHLQQEANSGQFTPCDEIVESKKLEILLAKPTGKMASVDTRGVSPQVFASHQRKLCFWKSGGFHYGRPRPSRIFHPTALRAVAPSCFGAVLLRNLPMQFCPCIRKKANNHSILAYFLLVLNCLAK